MTPEQLEHDYCASDGLFKALTHPLMKINCAFILTVIFMSYGCAFKAMRILLARNIYSNCTRMILMVGMANSMAHQTTMMVIRLRQLYRSTVSSSEDPCSILFHSPECIYELYLYYITNFFSTYSVFSLTFDRLLAHFIPNIYSRFHYLIGGILITIQLSLAVSTHLYGFYGVSFAGYVPMCNFPPKLATNFDIINKFRTGIISGCIGITLIMLFLAVRIEKKIHQKIYDTKTRYMAHENVLTTKAVCLIIISQFVCIMLSSFGVTLMRSFQKSIPEELYHLAVVFLPGVTYANLCLPVVIFFQTKRAISRRKYQIGKMTAQSTGSEAQMEVLKQMWLGQP